MSTNTPLKKTSKRISRLIERHLKLAAKGKAKFQQSGEALKKAISAGLMLDQPVEVELIGEDGRPVKSTFVLVDNFAGDVAYRPARVPHFEMKKYTASRRKRDEAAAPDAEKIPVV